MDRVKRVEVLYHNQIVGTLALDEDRACVFEYSALWLQNGFSISPFELPLQSRVFKAPYKPFEGGFGVFEDCLPDGWGLLLLQRYLQKQGFDLNKLSKLDCLTLVGSTGRGALEFRPDKSVMSSYDYIALEHLAFEAQKILDSETYMGEGIDELQQRGGSPGGARPKIFLNYEGNEWLVKFRAKGDPKNIGIKEYEYSLLAKKCGLEMPRTMLFDNKYFGVERFDRGASGKVHVVSISGLLRADYHFPCIDYLHVFQVCSALTHNMAEMWKVFRLMVFNYLIDNKDDHAKNFSFIYDDGHWHFSPAYDILPSDGIGGYRITSINDSIAPTDKDVIALATKVGLDTHKAEDILLEMRKTISTRSQK